MENNENLIILDEIKICPFTGKKYDAIIKVKCTCDCHKPNSNTIHFMPCCNNGYIEKYRYVE